MQPWKLQKQWVKRSCSIQNCEEYSGGNKGSQEHHCVASNSQPNTKISGQQLWQQLFTFLKHHNILLESSTMAKIIKCKENNKV